MKERDSDNQGRWEEEIWESHPLMERSIIKQDTYLNCWCPSCGTALNEDGKAVFRIVNQRGEEGISRVLAYMLGENRGMRRICKRLGFEFERDGSLIKAAIKL